MTLRILSYRRFVTTSGLVLVAAAGMQSVAVAQFNPDLRAPDFAHSFGVGSRAVAMGNAFTAIADDASATFWNVGRLGSLTRRQFMLEYRSAISSNSIVRNGSTQGGFQPEPLQLTFGSLIYPLGKEGKAGVLGASYTLGGYFRSALDSDLSDSTTEVKTTETDLLRNWYLTLGYGRELNLKSGKLGAGVAYIRVFQDGFRDTEVDTTSGGIVSQSRTTVHAHGRGDAYQLGFTFQPKGVDKKTNEEKSSPFRIGLAYRSAVDVSGLGDFGTGFGNEIPDRLSFGVAHESHVPKHPNDATVVSFEVQHFGPANQFGQADQRRAVTNLHFGAEYTPEKPLLKIPFLKYISKKSAAGEVTYGYTMPIRVGFRTNANAATAYTKYDNVFSIGTAIRGGPRRSAIWSFEPTMEILTSNAAVQWTLTGIFTF